MVQAPKKRSTRVALAVCKTQCNLATRRLSYATKNSNSRMPAREACSPHRQQLLEAISTEAKKKRSKKISGNSPIAVTASELKRNEVADKQRRALVKPPAITWA